MGLGLGRLEARPVARRSLLVLSLAANLGILFVFKYWTFFGASAESLGRLLGGDWGWPALDVVIPLGISFHTFQASPTRSTCTGGRSPRSAASSTSRSSSRFFPQLVAGPIERASHLLPQFLSRHVLDPERVRLGLRLCLIGLFKKMVVADNLAPFVDRVYGGERPAEPRHPAPGHLRLRVPDLLRLLRLLGHRDRGGALLGFV